jgi:hypothetical protein
MGLEELCYKIPDKMMQIDKVKPIQANNINTTTNHIDKNNLQINDNQSLKKRIFDLFTTKDTGEGIDIN